MTTLNQLLAGVRQVESGGNYHVVNSIGAVGAYQVMKANIPSWTRRALGHSLTWQQFRASRSAQDRVARYILGGYYRKYGAAGAASMWFSGQPNPNKRGSDGNTTIRHYVNMVLGAAGRSGSGISGGGSSGGGGSYHIEAVKPKLDRATLAEEYGLSSALINSSKELRSLFNKAVAGQWSATRFQAKLKNTRWWKKQSSTLRKYVTLKYTDPATWKQNRSNSLANIKVLAAKVGLDIKKVSRKVWDEAVYNDLAHGWSDARIKNWLGAKVQLTKGNFGMLGEAGEAFDKLHEIAYLNGVTRSTAWYKEQATKIVKGTSTIENQEQKLRRSAAATYSAFADQIKAGQNVMDLAAPYIKSLSQLLEIPETDVDLFEYHVHNAMAGAHAGENFPLWQFENSVRKDPRWKATNNARESIFTVAHQVAKDFGMAY